MPPQPDIPFDCLPACGFFAGTARPELQGIVTGGEVFRMIDPAEIFRGTSLSPGHWQSQVHAADRDLAFERNINVTFFTLLSGDPDWSYLSLIHI